MAITWLQIGAVQNIRQLASIWVSSKVWWFMQSCPWGHLHCQVTKLAAIHQHVGEYSSSQSKKMIFLFVQQYNLTIGRLEAFCTYIYIFIYICCFPLNLKFGPFPDKLVSHTHVHSYALLQHRFHVKLSLICKKLTSSGSWRPTWAVVFLFDVWYLSKTYVTVSNTNGTVNIPFSNCKANWNGSIFC